jgi:hypothetical protein
MRAAIDHPIRKRLSNQQKVSTMWRKAFLHANYGDAGDVTWAATAAGMLAIIAAMEVSARGFRR